ncbi:hypothetical protein FOZ60_008685 [Perkinsus olseni]|uniref:Uncharacterized protein n=1 Tax=Perkinsus olseni TaxID=32597 RepID=A0A7J6PDE5_PEROL|nr:hypothetical protein FOZ60_008685 [Perkinsus olseni]
MCRLSLLLLSGLGLALGTNVEAPRDRVRQDHDHCTAIAVDRAATIDGGCVSGTSADGSPIDFRMVYVPPKTYGAGEKRAVYKQAQVEVESEIDKMLLDKSDDGETWERRSRMSIVLCCLEIEEAMPGFCDDLTKKWFDLTFTLLGKYQNGYADWGYTKVGYGPSTEWLERAGFGRFAASKKQFKDLRRRYAKCQNEADEIRRRNRGQAFEAEAVVITE